MPKKVEYNQSYITSRVSIDADTGCWLWTRHIDRGGYAKCSEGCIHNRSAHKAAYVLFVGPIEAGMEIDHLCRVRHCVNPAHLEMVTKRENILRGISQSAINHRKTHCDYGHELNEQNTYIRKDGGARQCRVCNRRSVQEYSMRKAS